MTAKIDGTYAMTMHVDDLERARSFYGKGLGLEEAFANEEALTFAVPNSPPLTLHKWQSSCKERGARPPGTVSGIMLLCADPNAACKEIEAAGGKVTEAPFKGPFGTLWATVADPEGNEFMLCEPAE